MIREVFKKFSPMHCGYDVIAIADLGNPVAKVPLVLVTQCLWSQNGLCCLDEAF